MQNRKYRRRDEDGKGKASKRDAHSETPYTNGTYEDTVQRVGYVEGKERKRHTQSATQRYNVQSYRDRGTQSTRGTETQRYRDRHTQSAMQTSRDINMQLYMNMDTLSKAQKHRDTEIDTRQARCRQVEIQICSCTRTEVHCRTEAQKRRDTEQRYKRYASQGSKTAECA